MNQTISAFILGLFLTLACGLATAQTNPAPFNLSTGDYTFTGFELEDDNAYPSGMQGYDFQSERNTSNLNAPPRFDRGIAFSTTEITTGSIRNELENGISILNSGIVNLGSIAVAVNTTNRTNIRVSFIAQQLNNGLERASGLRLQYRVGTTGNFTDVSPIVEYLSGAITVNDAQTFSNIQMPVEVEGKANVQIRWVYYSLPGNSNRDRIRLDEIRITSSGPSLSGVLNIGSGEAISSLTNAGGLFEKINSLGLSGDLTVNLTSDLVSESGSITLNQISGGFPVTIRTDLPRLISGNSSTALIDLNGSDRVRFSGNNNLILRNTGTGATIRFRNDASDSTIENCTIESGGSAAIFLSAGSVTGNNNNSIIGNLIRERSDNAVRPAFGILSQSASPTIFNLGFSIANNTFSNFSIAGVQLENAENFTISGNRFSNTLGTVSGVIAIDKSSGSNRIENNVISDIRAGETFTAISLGAIGDVTVSGNSITKIEVSDENVQLRGVIFHNDGLPSKVELLNNMISLSPAASGDASIVGIGSWMAAGNTMNVYSNTVVIGGSSNGTTETHAFNRAAATGGTVNLANNIFFNARTGGGANNFAISDYSPISGIFTADYNIFVGTGTTAANFFYRSEGFGGDAIDFATWQMNSLAGDPSSMASVSGIGDFSTANMFVSNSDLHLRTPLFNPARNTGAIVGSVVTDFDGEARPFGSAPDIGADELYLAPTAATVELGGRVMTANGRGLSNVTVTISGGGLVEPRTIKTSSFGYYSFAGLAAGRTYVISVTAKSYQFYEPIRIVNLNDNIADADFIASK